MKFCLFLGCNMPAIRPDVELSIRLSLQTLGVEVLDIEGASCCPAFGTFPSVDEEATLAINAWNLANAERKGADIIVQCGSCYSSLKLGRYKLMHGKLEEINQKFLSKVGLRYEGKTDVRHLIDVMHNVIGVERIRNSLKFSMKGMKVVVQNPCHVLRPSKKVGFDDPENPVAFRNIVKALGAEVPRYSRERQCCGGAGGFAKHDKTSNLEFLKKKLDAMKDEVDPDCIAVSCITCLMHMDNAQAELRKLGMIDYQIPVFDYCQLLAICQGHEPSKVARIATTPRDAVIGKILKNRI
ncbi:MAG: CoB--CoM heterodisulfide reductase iron-sulfur subunit B family protein [Archaeoglobaceae archaeon]